MKTEVKKVDNNVRELSIEVSGEVVKNKFEDVFKRISAEAKIPGFRPGHAPRDILEKNYAAAAHEQVLKELVPDVYNEAVNKEGLDVIELPEISEVKLDRQALSFKAKVEVSPEIEVKDYKGIKIDYKSVSVAGDEVKRAIDALKESRKLDAADDALAKSLGYPSLAELEKVLERQIFIQKENAERQKIESAIIEGLIKKVDFKLPQGLVKRQLEDMLRQSKVDLALKGVAREKIEEQDEKMRKELEPE
ncbi:MAG: trigger factor, partial [Candidatus Omnitrophica bacterium]|nr:trigger factor [Candidatus Omnitrophota bacterium]